MSMTDVTVPYEILIRYNDAGLPQGAHILRRRIITIDGEIVKDGVSPAEPLPIDGFPTSGVMQDVARDALIAVNNANDQITAMQAEIHDLGDKLSLKDRDLEASNEANANLKALNGDLITRTKAMEAALEEARAQKTTSDSQPVSPL